jgi:hypothetical protein
MVVHDLADREIGSADLDHGVGVRSRQRQAVGLVPGPLGARRITLRQGRVRAAKRSRQSGIVDRSRSSPAGAHGRPLPVGVPASIPTPVRHAPSPIVMHHVVPFIARCPSPGGFGVAAGRGEQHACQAKISTISISWVSSVDSVGQCRTLANWSAMATRAAAGSY